MTPADYEDVFQLWIEAPGMGLNTLDDSRKGIARYLSRNPNTCFIARVNGSLVGAILSGHDGRRGFIYHTAVRVSQRKKGIGRILVQHALGALKAEGIHKVAFVAFKSNESGNSFWEHLGFTARNDLLYRNMVITEAEMKRIDT